ncbi:MAG: hypothetical protein IPK32_21725 [Verrucomicrobiaceae bacterium]|nr:hypothetical protein [Verrucomicrobiaceae bacterium]
MPFLVSAFSVPKRDAKASENQDAVWPRLVRAKNDEPSAGRAEVASKQGRVFVGVADGATEGVLAGEWANITLKSLSKTVGDIRTVDDVTPQLNEAVQTWERFKRLRTVNGTRPLTALPAWLEDEAVARGAFATACVVWFSDNGEWIGAAIGDSCVFHLRQDELIEAWPLSNSIEFNNSPYLVSSEAACNVDLAKHIKTCRSQWEREDRFYFATDALACWILKQHENHASPWTKLASFDAIAAPDEFSAFVEFLRESGEIRNDDTTLVRVTFIPKSQ